MDEPSAGRKTSRWQFAKFAVMLLVLALLVAACGQAAPPAPVQAPTEAPAAAPTQPPAAPTEAPAASAPTGLKEVPRNRTLVLAWWGDGQFVDDQVYTPFAIGGDYQKGLNLVYEGMAYWNAFKDETIMWQAESVEYNSDFTELTIHLRPEVTWSDGTPFTAEDVAYTINQLKELGAKVRHGSEVQQVTKEATVVDPQTVHITLNYPYPRYFDRFFTWKWDSGAFPIMPKHIFEGQDWSSFTHFDIAKGWPVTTGPLKVVFSSPRQKIFDRRDDWWAVKAGLTQPIAMERVVNVATGGDPSVLTELMVKNEIDITHLGPDSARAAVEKNPKVTTHYGRRPPYGYTDWWSQALWLNNETSPFDNPDVRWGISYFIDRQQIIDFAWEGLNEPNPMPYPPYPGLKKYTESIKDLLEQYNTNEYNPEKGAAHLEKAGYSKNSAGMWVDAKGETLKVPLISWTQWNAGAQVLVEQLKRAGIDATMTTPPDGWDQFIQRTYTAFPAGHTGSLKEPYDALNLYTCGKEGGPAANWASNQSKWCNPEFDKVVLEMSKVHPDDTEQMMKLFRQAMEIWLPELPSVQLFNWMHNFAMNETYWTNWPTTESEDGEYVNEASQLLGFHLVLIHLKPAQ